MSIKSYTSKIQTRYKNAGGNKTPPHAGTPEQIVEHIESYINAGVNHFIIGFMGDDFKKEVELFADEVVPNFEWLLHRRVVGRLEDYVDDSLS